MCSLKQLPELQSLIERAMILISLMLKRSRKKLPKLQMDKINVQLTKNNFIFIYIKFIMYSFNEYKELNKERILLDKIKQNFENDQDI